jgi:hypothetical protein
MSVDAKTLAKLVEYAVKHGPEIADAVKAAVDGFKSEHPELRESIADSQREAVDTSVDALIEAKFRRDET